MTGDQQHPSFARGGFTLLEVLVSAAVLSIVLAVMFSALSTSMNLWRNTDNKIVADREARAVQMMLARDISSALVTTNRSLWPSVTNSSGAVVLRFLTLAPAEYQPSSGSAGDVCYVEYAIVDLTNTSAREVRRLFWSSGATFSNVLEAGSFPTGNDPRSTNFQSLGLYLLPDSTMAARGLGGLATDPQDTAYKTNQLVVLGTNMLPYIERPGNYPTAIEVNFAVADPDTLANPDVIARTNFILRNAGLYSFRIPLPKPSNVP